MEKLQKSKDILLPLFLLLLWAVFLFPLPSWAAPPRSAAGALENEILTSLKRSIPCKKIEVRIRQAGDDPGVIKILAVKLEGVALGHMTADYMTIVYEKPLIDLQLLKRAKKFKILSAAKTKVSILISAKAYEDYLAAQARRLQNKNFRLSIRFSPPYVESRFSIPVSGISAGSLKLLNKYTKDHQSASAQLAAFLKGNKLEGYAAFQISARQNALSAVPAKVIVNHFVVPGAILQETRNLFNPFDRVAVLPPFQYAINRVTVQNNYLFFTN